MHLEETIRSISWKRLLLSSCKTIPIKRTDFVKVRELAAEFRRKLAELADATASPDEVYQINVQSFPLTKEAK